MSLAEVASLACLVLASAALLMCCIAVLAALWLILTQEGDDEA